MNPRVPPHSIDAEQAVLGGMMLDPRALERALALIGEDDFYRRDHREIFRAIVELDMAGKPYDAVTLGDYFEASGSDRSAVSYVTQLANTTPGAANITAHASIVRDKAQLRKMIEIGSQIVTDGFDAQGRDPQALMDVMIARLMAMQHTNAKVEYTGKQAAKKAYDAMVSAHANGGALRAVPSGLVDVDKLLGGFHPGDLIVVGARAAMGKTSFLVNIARNASEKGHAVGIVSGEQGAEQVAARMMSLAGNVAATKFRTGKFEEHEWPRVTDAFASMAKARMWILDRSSPSIAEVQRVARRWKQQHAIEALYVDYLQRLEAPGERRWESVGAAAKGLKNLARDLDIPIIVLAQVSRQVESGGRGREPRLGDLSDSSEIEKEADQVLMLYRDEYYNENSDKKGIAKVIIEKNRHGPTGYVEVAFHAETMRFADLSREYQDIAA